MSALHAARVIYIIIYGVHRLLQIAAAGLWEDLMQCIS